MKKNITLFLILIIAGAAARAQSSNKIAVSLGFEGSFPSIYATAGPGFSAGLEVPLAARLNFTFSAGYFVNYFGQREYLLDGMPANMGPPDAPGLIYTGHYAFIPLKVGLRYYYLKHFYVNGTLGEALKASFTDNSFIYGGAIGGIIPLKGHSIIDINIGYDHGYILADYRPAIYEVAIRVAYRYQF
jgi:hypothetical protein